MKCTFIDDYIKEKPWIARKEAGAGRNKCRSVLGSMPRINEYLLSAWWRSSSLFLSSVHTFYNTLNQPIRSSSCSHLLIPPRASVKAVAIVVLVLLSALNEGPFRIVKGT